MSSENTKKQLDSMTRSRQAQIAFLLAFVESQGLTAQLDQAIEQIEPDQIPDDVTERFLLDVDVLMSDAAGLAQDRARRVLQSGAVVPSEHYLNHQTDYTLAKHFISAFSNEMDFQFRPLHDSKEGRALIARMKSAM